jgi:hypothetical protein
MQWANISRTGTTADTGSSNGQPPLFFAGALSEQAACNTKDSGCRSFSPVRAWHELATALATIDVALGPVATDLDIVS